MRIGADQPASRSPSPSLRRPTATSTTRAPVGADDAPPARPTRSPCRAHSHQHRPRRPPRALTRLVPTHTYPTHAYPTHALAIPSVAKGKGGQAGGEYAIFPVPAMVLAAHYAKLPCLLPSTPAGSSRTASAMLPVLPLTLPSLHAFAILTPLCTPIAFPHPCRPSPPFLCLPLASPPALHALAAHPRVSSASNLSTLMRHAGHVKELWTCPGRVRPRDVGRAGFSVGGCAACAQRRPRCSPVSQPSRPRISHLPPACAPPRLAHGTPSRVPRRSAGLVLHARAASTGKGVGGDREAAHAIFLVHAVVLTAHCAKPPCLPLSARAGSSCTASATLPVLPFTLPSPHAFAILHAFMYTHRLAPALAALLPLPPAFLGSASWAQRRGAHRRNPPRDPRLPARVARPRLAPPRLFLLQPQRAYGTCGHVKELWQDMVALGVYDPELWDPLDLAWEVRPPCTRRIDTKPGTLFLYSPPFLILIRLPLGLILILLVSVSTILISPLHLSSTLGSAYPHTH
ncbi:hypothetical protein DFH09DRAFT_1459295 [Mycena vulgaris]|nr:hypothetical protein DFH09DRAFT_1459295 [Mycena vulgaris]